MEIGSSQCRTAHRSTQSRAASSGLSTTTRTIYARVIQPRQSLQTLIQKGVHAAQAQDHGDFRKPILSDFRHAVVAQSPRENAGEKELQRRRDNESCEQGDGKGRHGFHTNGDGTIQNRRHSILETAARFNRNRQRPSEG